MGHSHAGHSRKLAVARNVGRMVQYTLASAMAVIGALAPDCSNVSAGTTSGHRSGKTTHSCRSGRDQEFASPGRILVQMNQPNTPAGNAVLLPARVSNQKQPGDSGGRRKESIDE